MKEKLDDIIREYIDFINNQVGVYMDALAGFEGHHVRIERQVHRISKITGSKIDENGKRIVMRTSYEDPSQPDIIHNRIIRASDYIAANSRGGANEQQHAQATIVFIFTYWEEEIRPRLSRSRSVELSKINSDIMGDLRILRNVILHSKAIINPDKYKSLKLVQNLFKSNHKIHLSYDDMHKIFVLIKQDCARKLFEWLGVSDNDYVKPEELTDIAIQRCK
ncbi:MAG: hypothetical protein KAJ14_03275 [Candidatus Omnitrophica bacterium]|nr:hypothetical protein [Candidatus Omnitrophota bacterium]